MTFWSWCSGKETGITAITEGKFRRPFKRIVVSTGGGLLLVVVLYIFLRPESLFPTGEKIPVQIQNLLVQLGDSAIASRDVPISAVILYDGKVIGEGYNTVVRSGNAAGHAEINALSDAIRRTGMRKFMEMNRDSLKLISTYEPCPMCRAAMALYQIKRVEFLKQKSLTYRFREDIRSLIYRFREKEVGPDSLQDFLFMQHPDFEKQKF